MLRVAVVLAMFFAMPVVRLPAHAVPGMVVEAEFSPGGDVVLLVNMDPRLFLGPESEKTPPLPATWWFSQDESARIKTQATAAAFADAMIGFQFDGNGMAAAWQVQAVDSSSLVPLNPASAEVHLVAQHRSTLPAAAGSFSVTLSKHCPVPVMVVSSLQGSDRRVPQLMLPGETSRPLAISSAPRASAAQETPAEASAPAPATLASRWPQFAVEGHSVRAHVLFAFLLPCAMAGRFWSAAVFLTLFHVSGLLGASLTWAGWLPVKPGGMPRNCWMLLGGAFLFILFARRNPPALLALALLAGFSHGWGPWNQAQWHGLASPLTSVFRREGLLMAAEMGVLLISVLWLRAIRDFLPRRFRPGD